MGPWEIKASESIEVDQPEVKQVDASQMLWKFVLANSHGKLILDLLVLDLGVEKFLLKMAEQISRLGHT